MAVQRGCRLVVRPAMILLLVVAAATGASIEELSDRTLQALWREVPAASAPSGHGASLPIVALLTSLSDEPSAAAFAQRTFAAAVAIIDATGEASFRAVASDTLVRHTQWYRCVGFTFSRGCMRERDRETSAPHVLQALLLQQPHSHTLKHPTLPTRLLVGADASIEDWSGGSHATPLVRLRLRVARSVNDEPSDADAASPRYMWHIYHVEWKNDLASGDESGAAARLAAWIVATWRGGGVFEARSSTEATSLLWSLGQYDAARLLGLRLSQSSPPAVASSSLGHPAVDTGDFADASFDSAETTPLLGSATDEWNEYVRKEAASAAAAAAAAETVSTARPVVIALRHKMHLGVPSVAHVAAFRTAAAMAENSALTFASITAESIGMDGLVRLSVFFNFPYD